MIAPRIHRPAEEPDALLTAALRIVDLLQDLADSARIIATREQQEDRQSKALRLLVELGTDNVSAIAKAVGVSRRTLYRWNAFTTALERMRAAEAWSLRSPRAIDKAGSLIGEA